MKCMRCGTKIKVGSVFCDDCLADMEKHPVKPDTPINLPRREKQQPVKRSKKRIRKPEEQITILRRTVYWLIGLVLVMALTLTATVYMLFTHAEAQKDALKPGQNYGTSSSVP